MMFSMIRKRFTYANVALTLALVFAMTGGAYAAKKYLITSTKQIKPSVLVQLKGKNGKNGTNGTNGTNGAQGPAGEKGAAGTNGTIGKDGVSVASSTEPKGANCKEGGSKFVAANGTTYACNGSPWTAGGTLPVGASETGQWAWFTKDYKQAQNTWVPISFEVPLKAGPTPQFIPPGVSAATGKGNLTIHSNTVTNLTTTSGEFIKGSAISGTGIPGGTTIKEVLSSTELELSEEATATGTGVELTAPGPPAGCTGNFKKPGAESSNLCVFVGTTSPKFSTILAEVKMEGFHNAQGEGEAGETGTVMQFSTSTSEEGRAFASGTWVVTG
jgi:hypothetical protein